jgi:hypothetical protein
MSQPHGQEKVIQQRVLHEAQSLLAGVKWDVEHAGYVTGEHVAVMIQPRRSLLEAVLPLFTKGDPTRELAEQALAKSSQEQMGPKSGYDVSILVYPLQGRLSMLEGASIWVQQEESDHNPLTTAGVEKSPSIGGQLNARGQVVFSNLKPGLYTAELTVVPTAEVAEQSQGTIDRALQGMRNMSSALRRMVLGSLIPAPRQSLAMSFSGLFSPQNGAQARWRKLFSNADDTLQVTIWESESGAFAAHFFAKDRKWDGTLLAFGWRPPSDNPDALLDEQSSRSNSVMLVPLSWSKLYSACVADVPLGRLPHELDPLLPARPLQLEQLTEDAAELIRKSIRQVDTDHTRQAWVHLAANVQLPAGTASVIRDALGLPPRIPSK